MSIYLLTSAYVSAHIRADSTSEAFVLFEAAHGVRATTCRVIA
jgi:hypothetical protein